MSVNIILDNCVGCKACFEHCPNDIIGWNTDANTPYIAHPDECSHCGVCMLECAYDAIRHIIPLACWDDMSTIVPAVHPPRKFDHTKFI